MKGDVKIKVPHGTISGYTRYGCRQTCCVEAMRLYRREQAKRLYWSKKAKQAGAK